LRPERQRKRLREELDRGVAEANAMIPGSLFTAAKAGNITAIIFRLKTRAHWREQTAEGAIANPDAGSNSEVVPVLRDNNRDLALTRVLQDAQQKYLAGRPHRQQLSISGIAGTNPWLLTPLNS
jgi:hypothetical protein